MAKPSPVTSGKEGRFHFQLDEKWPDIVALTEAPEDTPGTVLPAKLVRAHEKAVAALKAAEADLARWVKYSDPGYAKAYLGPLLNALEPLERPKR